MCGIWSYIDLCNKLDLTPDKIANLMRIFYNLKHRGPDNSFFETYGNVCIGFHRLAIVSDNFISNQPFVIEADNKVIVFVCNAEIYNHKELRKRLQKCDYIYKDNTRSDCEVIPLLYLEHGPSKFQELFKYNKDMYIRGEFAFTLFEFTKDKHLQRIVAGRDSVGVRPLYYSSSSNTLIFSSEIKGIDDITSTIREFPPGQIMIYNFDELYNLDNITMNKFFNPKKILPLTNYDISEKMLLKDVYSSVINSIRCRLDTDKPVAFLLSGGVDSSLVAGISAKILGRPIRTFCCGMVGGTDLQYARKVAEHIGSDHTEVIFTPEEGLAAITDVIYTTETWDTTTIRASVIQYLVSKWIGEKTDCKVLMVGEGVDEICSSYLFNWYAPSGEALHNCAVEYINKIHLYDVKRADRCIARWGLEARVPYLDPMFINAYWTIPSDWRMPGYKGIEKWWLREAFNGSGVIPDEVLWRKKEAQSDGASSKEKSWFQIIQDWIETKVTDEELRNASSRFSYCTPLTKEAYYYRTIFVKLFRKDTQTIIPGFWQPKWLEGGKEVTKYVDPSARILNIYNS